MTEIKIGEKYQVVVIKYLEKGVLVTLADGSYDESLFIHLSKISPKFVTDVSDFVTVGETYEVEVNESSIPGKPFELSLLHLNLQSKHPYTPRAPRRDNPPSLNTSQQHKQYPQRRPSDHGKPRSQRPNKSFDDMLKSAEAAYNDKFRGKGEPRGKRRKRR